MLNTHQGISNTHWPICTCCGQTVRLLLDRQTMLRFLNQTAARRRAYQCKNCGQITCFICSPIDRHCHCNSNAWVALPYLEDTEGVVHTQIE